MAIKFVGLKHLSQREDADLNRICKRSFPKLERESREPNLTFVIKRQEKKGAKPKFILKVTLNDPPSVMKAEAEDWAITTAAHQIFDKLQIELKKKETKKRQKTVTI